LHATHTLAVALRPSKAGRGETSVDSEADDSTTYYPSSYFPVALVLVAKQASKHRIP